MVESLYLELAIKEAWKTQCQTLPNPAVGAVVLDKNGKLLSTNAHQEAGKPHAEVLALKEAYFKLTQDSAVLPLQESHQIHQYLKKNAKDIFKDSTLYTTLEPCMNEGKTPSCASLIKNLGIKNLITAAKDPNPEAKGGAEYLANCGIKVSKIWETPSLQALSTKAQELLLPFSLLQKKGSFVLFKYASRLDGSIDGGQISSKETQTFMHNLRSKLDNLLISGKTILLDNPTLDSRFCALEDKKTPNITILTKNSNFPQTAPLFAIPNREVRICHSIPEFSGFVMCEGGSALLESLLPYIDMLLVFLNPSFAKDFHLTQNLNARFKILHHQAIGEDLALWLLPQK